MVTKNILKQPKAQVELQITVPWTDIQVTYDATLARMAAEVEVPGFRKGQVPLPMAEQALGRKLEDEVLKVVMPNALIEALNGTTVVPIDYPQYQVVSFQKGGELKFVAKLTERPTITVGDYKTIKVPKPNLKPVSEEEVNKVIDELYRRWKVKNPTPPATPPSQPAQGSAGSMSFNTANQLTSESANQNPGQPVSQSASQLSSDQPAGSASHSDAGGPNDTFAQAVGAANLADLKTKIKADLENESKYNSELDYEEAILQEVEKITTVDIPEILIQDELNRMLVSLQRSVTERGLLLDEYLKSQNKTVEALKDEWRPQAEKNVRMELGLSEVARIEGVNIADEELQAEIDKIQDQRVKAQFAQEEPKMHLRHALRQTKTLNLLKGLVG